MEKIKPCPLCADEYAEGRLAYLLDRAITANPHDHARAPEHYNQWRAGWVVEHHITRAQTEKSR